MPNRQRNRIPGESKVSADDAMLQKSVQNKSE